MKKISLSVKGFFKLASALSSGHLFSGNALAKDIPPVCPLRLNQAVSLLCPPYREHHPAYRAGLVL